jgi:hypothetical protein
MSCCAIPGGVLALVIRCLTCRGIACAQVLHHDVWPPQMERMPVEQVRHERWCRCGEKE